MFCSTATTSKLDSRGTAVKHLVLSLSEDVQYDLMADEFGMVNSDIAARCLAQGGTHLEQVRQEWVGAKRRRAVRGHQQV